MSLDLDTAIQLENISVRYRLWEQGRPTLANLFRAGTGARDFWALQDISFRVRRGEVVGIVGHNGAGKSTLLRVIARVLPPHNGRIIVRGRVSPLVELSAGMDPDLTGRENIYLKAAMLGRTRAETEAQFERIVEFAGLREFIDQPLRTYSSGMSARLGFAIATDVEPDILIVDEVLSVGDAEFTKRSRERMAELRGGGATVLIASHNSSALRGMCDRILWLSHGRVQMIGSAARVLNAYDRAGSAWDAANAAPAQDTARVYALDSDETLFALEFTDALVPEFRSVVQAPFDPNHISPAQNFAELPPYARRYLAGYRFLHGTFFYDQVSRLLERPPVTVTMLRDPHTRGHFSDNLYTRRLGARGYSDKAAGDEVYLAQSVTRVDLMRAYDVLETLAFVGILEKPLESLLLFWHTLGWEPPMELPAVTLPLESEEPGSNNGADEFDIALYAHALELFEERFASMLRELKVEGANLTLVHQALRAQYVQRAMQTEQKRAIRWHMDRALAGRGWYNVQYNPDYGAYRWTGPEPRAVLQLPLPGELRNSGLQLHCNLIFQDRSPALGRLAVRVNDVPVPWAPHDAPDGSLNVTTEIPRAQIGEQPFLNLVLDVGETFTPTNGYAQDSRKLGIAVRWLELSRYE